MNFYPCELHCHSVHSDGDFEISQLQHDAVSYGLKLIALTDHNTQSGLQETTDICPVLSGMEWTTYFGHMLVIGGKNFVDWRSADIDNIDEKIALLKQGGAIVGVAHPFQLGSPMCTGGRWEFNVRNWNNIDYIEIFHYSFERTDENVRSYRMWHSLLDKGYHLAVTFGRDWHRPSSNMAPGCTYLISEKADRESAFSAIMQGKTILSAGAILDFSVLREDKIHTIGEVLSEGKYEFSIHTSLNERKEYCGNFEIEYEYIKIVTNHNECVSTLPASGENGEISLKKHHWYTSELWGTINGKEALLSVTSPIYCE